MSPSIFMAFCYHAFRCYIAGLVVVWCASLLAWILLLLGWEKRVALVVWRDGWRWFAAYVLGLIIVRTLVQWAALDAQTYTEAPTPWKTVSQSISQESDWGCSFAPELSVLDAVATLVHHLGDHALSVAHSQWDEDVRSQILEQQESQRHLIMLRDIYAPIFLRLQQLGPNVYLPVGYRAADLGKFIDEDVLPAIIESNARCVTSHSAAVQPSGTRNALRERLTITRDVYSQGLYPHDMPSGDIQHALTRISICEESIDDLYRDPHSGVNGCLTSAIERFQKEWDVGGNGGWKEDHMRRLERNLGHWAAFCADEKPNVEPLSLLPMGGQL